MTWTLRLTTVVLGMLMIGCALDPAEREYVAALHGEETGMTRTEQIGHLDRAIQLAPRRAQYYETRAIYRIDLRQYDRARDDLDQDVALLPRPYAYFLRGLVTCESGHAGAALGDFDRAIAGQPSNTQFYRGRSLARSVVGDTAGALVDAEHLVAVVPQQAESWYARGVSRALQGRDAEAVADFDKAAQIRPELIYVIEARAGAFDRLGDPLRSQADRQEVERLRAANAHCAACVDPFRY